MKKIKLKKPYFVYIVECNDGTYYTGSTPDLKNRLNLHNTGKGAKYTRGRRPVKLIWSKKYPSLSKALSEEIKIKNLTRLKKEIKIGTHPILIDNISSSDILQACQD